MRCLHICNVTRPRTDMSRMNTQNAPSLFVPEPKRSNIRQACRSGKGWRFFPLYGCGKNTTSYPIAWTGYVWLVTINQVMGGQSV